MSTFTGYEPKTPGKELSSGSRGGALAPTEGFSKALAASAAADAALLPVSSDSLSRDLGGLLNATIDEE